MTTIDELRDLERRPVRYWSIDGIPELVLGAVWCIWGVALLVGDVVPRIGPWRVYWLVMPALLVLTGVAANRVTLRLKQRLTYPRTGWVAMPPPSKAVRVMAAGVAVASAALLAGWVLGGRAHGVEYSTPAAAGLLCALAFLVAAVRQGTPHLLALSGVALMLGLGLTRLGLDLEGINWLLLGLGVASVAVGALRLSRFLRRHPLEAA